MHYYTTEEVSYTAVPGMTDIVAVLSSPFQIEARHSRRWRYFGKQGLVIGSKMGIRPDVLLRVFGEGLAHSHLLDLRGRTMIEHSFEPGGKAKLHYKDLGIALEAAREYGVVLPGASLVTQLFMMLVEGGKGELDHSALLTVLETLSHHSLVNLPEEQAHP